MTRTWRPTGSVNDRVRDISSGLFARSRVAAPHLHRNAVVYARRSTAFVCAPGRTRTCGQALRRRLLYPLSYGGRTRSRRWASPLVTMARSRIGVPVAGAVCFTSATPCGGSVKRSRYSQAGTIHAAVLAVCRAGVAQSLWVCPDRDTAVLWATWGEWPHSHPKPVLFVAQCRGYASKSLQIWAFCACGDLERTA
jgi:hypothetical protein